MIPENRSTSVVAAFQWRELPVEFKIVFGFFTLTGAGLGWWFLLGLYVPGYVRGFAEAQLEWWSGEPTIHTFGLQPSDGVDHDPDTGLPYKTIAGCVVDEGILGRTDGHNGHIRTLVRAREFAANLDPQR